MSASSRIVGLDIASSLAIIGMVVLHMASLVWHTKVILNGLPAALFAILAGITLMIIARNFTVTTLLRILARGCIITLIGLALLPLGGDSGRPSSNWHHHDVAVLGSPVALGLEANPIRCRHRSRDREIRSADPTAGLPTAGLYRIFPRRHAAL